MNTAAPDHPLNAKLPCIGRVAAITGLTSGIGLGDWLGALRRRHHAAGRRLPDSALK